MKDPQKAKKINTIFLIVGLITVLIATVGLFLNNQPEVNFVKGVSPQDIYPIINKTVILDISSYERYQEGHLNRAFSCPIGNISINLENWSKNITENFYKDQTYLIYCHVGEDAQYSAERLHALGFERVYYLLGGFTRWKLENYPYM
jgi:rhodanese-related sulfurtransferase